MFPYSITSVFHKKSGTNKINKSNFYCSLNYITSLLVIFIQFK